jgi:Peptidase family M28
MKERRPTGAVHHGPRVRESPRHDRLARLVAALVACAAFGLACGDDGGGSRAPVAPDGAVGEAPADGGADAGAAPCTLVGGCPDWLEEYEREVVAALTGESAIAGGVALAARFTEEERALARTYLMGELSRLGLEPELHDYGSGANVFAELPATEGGDALVVLGAHLDTVAGVPGAADNGTGVALVLAAARYLSSLERRELTVVFALFDEEEVGLLGSQALADELRLQGETVAGMHNFDMISWDQDGDRGVELWAPSAELEPLYRDAAAELGVPIASHEIYGSDHASFLGSGFPAVGVGEQYVGRDTTPHYHRPSDAYDKVDFGFLVSSTRLALRAIELQLGADRSR